MNISKKSLMWLMAFGFVFNGLNSIDNIDSKKASRLKELLLSVFYAGSAIVIKEKSGIAIEANNELIKKYLSGAVLAPGMLEILKKLIDPCVSDLSLTQKELLISRLNKVFKVTGKTYSVCQNTIQLLGNPYVQEVNKSNSKALGLLISLGVMQYFLSKKITEKMESGTECLLNKMIKNKDATQVLSKITSLGVNDLVFSKVYNFMHSMIVSKVLYDECNSSGCNQQDKEIIKYSTSLVDLVDAVISKK